MFVSCLILASCIDFLSSSPVNGTYVWIWSDSDTQIKVIQNDTAKFNIECVDQKLKVRLIN